MGLMLHEIDGLFRNVVAYEPYRIKKSYAELKVGPSYLYGGKILREAVGWGLR